VLNSGKILIHSSGVAQGTIFPEVSDLARRTHQLRIEHSHDAVRGDEYVQEETVDLR